MSNISHHLESNCLIAAIKEEFNEDNAISIKDAILKLLENNSYNLLLDLNQVRMIRSSGLRVILSFAKDFKNQNRQFAVLYSKNDQNYQVFKILEVSGFTKIISIYSTRSEALEEFAK